jgi:hypothetical protein
MQRLIGLLITLLLAGCSTPQPPHDYAPLSYAYLTKLHLSVASISIDDSWTPRGGVRDVSSLSPVQPIDALREMAQDRLVADGNSARAVFHIENASIIQIGGDRFDGHLDVMLDIYNAENIRTAYAEAQVSGAISGVGTGPEEVRQTLYTLTKQMMDDMNVEFEYQLKHALHDWLLDNSPSSGAVPAPVQAQPLAAPVD